MRLSCCLLVALSLGSACATTSEPEVATPVPCAQLPERDAAYISELLRLWAHAVEKDLAVYDNPLPWAVYFNTSCTFHVEPASAIDGAKIESALAWRDQPLVIVGVAHDGEIALPGGGKVKAGPMAFSSLRDGGNTFFALALPELWAKHPMAARMPNAGGLILSIALHEHTHTLQLATLAKYVRDVVGDAGGDVNERALEAPFKDDAEYQSAYRQEIDLLWAAVESESDSDAMSKVQEASVLRAARHARSFTDARANFAKLEGPFYNLEGLAEWVRFRALSDPERLVDNPDMIDAEPLFDGWSSFRDMPPKVLRAQLRKQTKKETTQEAGFALALLVHRLRGADGVREMLTSALDPYALLLRE